MQRLPFPLLITATHLAFKFSAAAVCRALSQWYGRTPKVEITWRVTLRQLAPQGLAAGLDIGLSNWGLALVTISLYTMTKTTSIIFILVFSLIFRLEQKSWRLVVIVLMISTGLLLFTYKSTQFNFFGFFLVLLATFISGLRWTLAQLLMQKSQLGLENPIDMMYYVQPWMLLIVVPLALIFEAPRAFGACATIFETVGSVLLGAVIAFCMEAAELLLVSTASSLTLSVVGVLKEVLILVLAVEWSGDQVSTINVLGLCTCLSGMLLHVISKAITSRQLSKEGSTGTQRQITRRNDGRPLLQQELFEEEVDDSSEESDVVFTALNAHQSFNATLDESNQSNRSFWRKDIWH